jgi:hypothetical protein
VWRRLTRVSPGPVRDNTVDAKLQILVKNNLFAVALRTLDIPTFKICMVTCKKKNNSMEKSPY